MYREQRFVFPGAAKRKKDIKSLPQYALTSISCREPLCQDNSCIDLSIKRRSRTKTENIGVPFLLPYDQQPKDRIVKNFFLQKNKKAKPEIKKVAYFPRNDCATQTDIIGKSKDDIALTRAMLRISSDTYFSTEEFELEVSTEDEEGTSSLYEFASKARERKKQIVEKKLQNLQSTTTHEHDDIYLDSHESDLSTVATLRETISEQLLENLQHNFAKKASTQHRYSTEIYKLSYVLRYWYNPYEILRLFLPLPCMTCLKDANRSNEEKIYNAITNLKYIASYVKHCIECNKEFDMERNDIILSIDAIDVKLFEKNKDIYKSVFIFYGLPTNKAIKCFPIFAMQHKTGKMTFDVTTKTSNIITQINKLENIYIPIKAVDGDPGSNVEHSNQFKNIYKDYKEKGFNGVISTIAENINSKNTTYIITDMIHFGKNRRTQLILIGLTLNDTEINLSPLYKILENSGAVNDKSNLSKLQDAFPVEIFNFYVISELLKYNAWDLILFILPMACWLEACLNKKLDKPSRLLLLKIAFLIYMRIYEMQCQRKSKNEFQMQISLMRAINTIAVLYEEFEKSEDSFCFARYSTMIQEHFHGQIRGMNTNNDNVNEVLRNIAKAALIYQYKRELDIPTNIKTRLSVGGIHWEDKVHTYTALPLENDVIIDCQTIIDFFFSKSVYKTHCENRKTLNTGIIEWINKVKEGTYMLTTSYKAFHGRHILTRQITNSKNVKERLKMSLENDVEESEEERELFNDDIIAFNQAMNEEDDS